MASSGTNRMIHLLCWNRGKEHRPVSKSAWDTYWDSINPKPDIVFLQEEMHAITGSNNLFIKGQRDYEEYLNSPEAAVMVKSTIAVADLNFSQLVYDVFVNNAPDPSSDKKLDDEFTNPITTMLGNMFQFFRNHGECIDSGSADFKKKQEANRSPNSSAITIDIIKDLKDRICIVPLNVQELSIIAVSFHAKSKTGDKGSKITNLFKFLDELGHSTGCCAVVVGGDFNIDLLTDGKGIDLCGFIVPPYDPTIHRAIHGRVYMCIDFFAYKNFLPNTGVEVEQVCSKMIIKCPDLVSGSSGEYHISLEKYNNDNYKMLRIASNHDPLQARLTLYNSPPHTPLNSPPRTPHTSSSTPHLFGKTLSSYKKRQRKSAREMKPRCLLEQSSDNFHLEDDDREDDDYEEDDDEEDDDEEDDDEEEDQEKDDDVACLQQGVKGINLSSASIRKPST
ncbi:uncharacterized protein [Dysidea avara]|uniref:uncharacterized protein n=1 Tax=Dysidea avara TaxID=196820 RepID=UPI0033253C21